MSLFNLQLWQSIHVSNLAIERMTWTDSLQDQLIYNQNLQKQEEVS